MFKILTKEFNFTFELHWSPDGTHGILSDNGSWSGIIGSLARNEADLSIGAFTITPPRAEVTEAITYTWFV